MLKCIIYIKICQYVEIQRRHKYGINDGVKLKNKMSLDIYVVTRQNIKIYEFVDKQIRNCGKNPLERIFKCKSTHKLVDSSQLLEIFNMLNFLRSFYVHRCVQCVCKQYKTVFKEFNK